MQRAAFGSSCRRPTPGVSADVVLWRDARGTARASLGTPQGAPLEPHRATLANGHRVGLRRQRTVSDLALSVLTAVVGAEAAERHYRALVAEVVSRVPRPGGVMRADSVRAWVRRQDDPGAEPDDGPRGGLNSPFPPPSAADAADDGGNHRTTRLGIRPPPTAAGMPSLVRIRASGRVTRPSKDP